MEERKEIENNILRISNELLQKWNRKFDEHSIRIDPIAVYRNGNKREYFSEIEFNFWKEDSLESVFSIIIFMNNELVLEGNDIEEYINGEIEKSYIECLSLG